MNTVKGTKSVFGDSQRTCYIYVKDIEDRLKRKYNVLVVDAVDGLNLMPFARKGNIVDGYEPNEIYYNGGKIDSFNICGLKKKIEYEKLTSGVNFYIKNYYKQKVEKKYDFVYVFRSLHKNCNKDIPMQRKMRKLLSSVKENGYIYILYHLAKEDKDYVNYSKNQYFRPFEMKIYFDENWEILNAKEEYRMKSHKSHPENIKNHEHRVGYIFARKLSDRTKYKYHYNIKVGINSLKK